MATIDESNNQTKRYCWIFFFSGNSFDTTVKRQELSSIKKYFDTSMPYHQDLHKLKEIFEARAVDSLNQKCEGKLNQILSPKSNIWLILMPNNAKTKG